MEDALYNPEINDNSIDSAFPPSYETNYISKKPYIQVSTVALPSSLQPFNTKATTTKRPHVYNNKTYEFVSSSTKVPHFNTTTVNYSVNFGGFSTTLGTITQRNLTTILMRDETTTEKIKFTTFQSIQDVHLKNATQTITKSTSTLPKTTKRTPTTTKTATTTVKSVSITNKPLKVSSKQPKPSVGVTVKPTTVPIKVTSKANATQTSRPATTPIINRVKVTSRPPTVVTTVKPLKDKTTTPTTGTIKQKQTTSLSPRRTTTVSSKRTTTPSTSVETTRAPRPNPQPTSEIVKVQPTTIYQDIITSTANPQLFANKNTVTTTEKTKPSSTTEKKPTKKPATTTRLTTKQTTTTTTTNAPSTTVKTTTASEQLIYSPTSNKHIEQNDQITTTPGGFFTWTLSSNNVDNTTKSMLNLYSILIT